MTRFNAWQRLRDLWVRAFVVERPSVGLSLFRIAVAVTVGCHMIPSFLQLPDNYLATAFKEQNGSFFPIWALQMVERSPDWFVCAMVGLFLFAWMCFLVGFKTQLSAIVMTAGCYYFYALNSLHIGTLSFDILLVTLSLVWVSGYLGDWLSVDCLLRGDPEGYRRPRPFFIQRLLQLQITWTYWYTALSKITGSGNWLVDNPYYYLMRYPAQGVVRMFPGRAWLASSPELCRAIAMGVLIGEFTMPLLLWIRKTRLIGLALACVFHLLLLVTLHVPTIFLFLFPAQLMLFIEPERIVAWIDARRAAASTLLYDGRCGLCLDGMRLLRGLDLFSQIRLVDFHTLPDPAQLHPVLSADRCRSRMQLIESDGTLTEGFSSLRRLSLKLPTLWGLAPILRLPGMGRLGPLIYDWIAQRRLLWHRGAACRTNQCVATMSDGSSKL